MINLTQNKAVRIQPSRVNLGDVTPLFFDSPHSGSIYPADYDFILRLIHLRQAEDTYIEELYEEAPNFGATLIDAQFPRSYIDVNRNELDFAPADLADDWPGKLKPGPKAELGTGLAWVRLFGSTDIYASKLTAAQLQHRINTYWKPYHDAISKTHENLFGIFGCVYHVNCHSMPAVGNSKSVDGPVDRPDFILGDRDGSTCEASFTQTVKEYLEQKGYTVAINYPFKGVELIRRYSNPKESRHSLQIEINRRLYMNEITLEKIGGYNDLKTSITGLIKILADYAKTKIK
jgi:N-formylglutamate amidohydrolase